MAASAERLVPMLTFCEAPFDGILDGTSVPSPFPARGSAAASIPSSGYAAASRDEMLMEIAKEFAKPSSQRRGQAQQQQQQEEKAAAVDDLAIFEAVVLQLQ
ncbi:unnamed protein product [Urochloa decumbens]|uniref:Uncharacterized protein n=1 Tax=Urochloa decumbens TaxID=240449 RepID=A0ABC9DUX5_9POAL